MLLSLIDRASTMCSSDADLARFLGCSRSLVSKMRTGERHVSPDHAVLMATLVGDDAMAALLAAHVASKLPLPLDVQP